MQILELIWSGRTGFGRIPSFTSVESNLHPPDRLMLGINILEKSSTSGAPMLSRTRVAMNIAIEDLPGVICADGDYFAAFEVKP